MPDTSAATGAPETDDALAGLGQLLLFLRAPLSRLLVPAGKLSGAPFGCLPPCLLLGGAAPALEHLLD